MKIYLVYEKDYADFRYTLDDAVYINNAYKNKRKAIKKAKELLKNAKDRNLYIDEDIQNKKNPFKKHNWVDLYEEENNKDSRVVSSIIIEETKLVA